MNDRANFKNHELKDPRFGLKGSSRKSRTNSPRTAEMVALPWSSGDRMAPAVTLKTLSRDNSYWMDTEDRSKIVLLMLVTTLVFRRVKLSASASCWKAG